MAKTSLARRKAAKHSVACKDGAGMRSCTKEPILDGVFVPLGTARRQYREGRLFAVSAAAIPQRSCKLRSSSFT